MKRAFGNKLLNEYRLFVILVIIIIALQAATHGLFLQKGNIINLFNQNAMLGIITIGQFLVILTGGNRLVCRYGNDDEFRHLCTVSGFGPTAFGDNLHFSRDTVRTDKCGAHYKTED